MRIAGIAVVPAATGIVLELTDPLSEAVRRVVQRPPPDDALILKAYLSEDFHEGVEAFLARRKPRWKGK